MNTEIKMRRLFKPSISIDEFHPHADGQTLDTLAFQKALDAAKAQGGGLVYVPAGTYLCGGLYLHSNITLYLEQGAVVLISAEYEDFLTHRSSVVCEQSDGVFLFARGEKNITISGYGVIDGDSERYHSGVIDDWGNPRPKDYRPRMIVLEDCTNIHLNQFQLLNAPMWAIHLIACDTAYIENITLKNEFYLANTDGIDLDSSQNIHISNCHIVSADDCICLKTTQKADPSLDRECRNITVTNCTLSSHSCAIKIGTETWNDIRFCTFSNCLVYGSNRGIGIWSRDGGKIEHIHFAQMMLETQLPQDGFWGRGDPIFVSAAYRQAERSPGKINNIHFHEITAVSENCINFHGISDCIPENLTLQNIHLQLPSKTDLVPFPFDIRPPVKGSDTTEVLNGFENSYSLNSEGDMVGVFTKTPETPGLYSHLIQGLVVQNFHVS